MYGVVAAQNYQEVVYLKNGSVIHGVVIEQIPNESIKIKTYDGNIFAYKMSDVEKITKEEQPTKNSDQRNNRTFVAYDNFNTNFSSNSRMTNHNNYRERGYKGFVVLGISNAIR